MDRLNLSIKTVCPNRLCIYCAVVCKPIVSMYGIFTYIYHKNQFNVGKYTSPMDGMGSDLAVGTFPARCGKALLSQRGIDTPASHLQDSMR